MNISELARRLRTNPDELREKLPELGFDVGAKAIKVDPRLVGKIQDKWSEMKRRERLKMKYSREEKIKEEAVAKVKDVELPSVLTVRDFAGKLGLPFNIVISELMKNGILASVNERIDFETASIVAEDLGYEVAFAEKDELGASESMSADELKDMLEKEKGTGFRERSPVVVVMGHVDHGKTQLLDAIRMTDVVNKEAGGITQHIGAYQVEAKDRRITFIDTPGHEAFTVMRSRGARVADIAILVVAVDDGVQPQTVEVINIIKAAKLPFVVALNKIDKPDIDIQKVKTQLSDHGVIPEEWGGKTVMAEVSAKTGKGIDSLLDMILLTADMDKEKIIANPDRNAVGTVIESHVDKGEGAVATILVQAGTLRRNDVLAIGGSQYGRVRVMKDWNGEAAEEAPPGTPVKILGFKTAPQVGDIVEVPEDVRALKKLKKQYSAEKQTVTVHATTSEEDEEEIRKQEFKIVLKADVLGSLEAIVGTLEKMKTPDVGVTVVGKGLGHITEGDVLQAEATGGVVMGFNVHPTKEADILAKDKGVEILIYRIIYELFDEAKRRLQELLPAEVIQTDLGKLEVLAIFKGDKKGQVVGGEVKEGKIIPNANIVLYRNDEPVDEGKIKQLQIGKSDVKEARQGQQCGLKVTCKRAVEVGDVMEAFTVETKEQKLELPQ